MLSSSFEAEKIGLGLVRRWVLWGRGTRLIPTVIPTVNPTVSPTVNLRGKLGVNLGVRIPTMRMRSENGRRFPKKRGRSIDRAKEEPWVLVA